MFNEVGMITDANLANDPAEIAPIRNKSASTNPADDHVQRKLTLADINLKPRPKVITTFFGKVSSFDTFRHRVKIL